jgi:GNAT superfamily N-acetyltransferase
MHPETILHLYDQEMRQNPYPAGGAVHQRPGLTYFTLPSPSPFAGWVLYTRLDPAAAEQAIPSTLEFFAPWGGEFEWKVYDHDTPPDLKERLLARGFVPDEPESLLALDLETVPPAFWQPPAADVRRLADPAQLSIVTGIEAEVWGEDFSDLEETLAAEMQAVPGQLSVYVAYADGQPASSAWTRFYPLRQFAELYGGATLPRHRGQGLYTALVKTRAHEARQRGVRFLMVDASAMSRPVLEKLGFVFLTHTQPFIMKFPSA